MRCFTVHPIVIKWVRDVGVTGGGSGVGAKDNNCPIFKLRVACFKFSGGKRKTGKLNIVFEGKSLVRNDIFYKT